MPNRRKKENPWILARNTALQQETDNNSLEKMNMYDKQHLLGYRKGKKLFLEGVSYNLVLEKLPEYCKEDHVPLAVSAHYKDGVKEGYQDAERNK